MTKGCLLFAFNNDVTDYVSLANSSAKNIKRHLDLPTTIVTNNTVQNPHNFENVIVVDQPEHGVRHFTDYEETVQWINFGRHQAYNLSPYDKTLLLDVDYVIASDRLKMLFDTNKDFLCHNKSFNVSGQCFEVLNKFGVYGMPMPWATVVYFTKSKTAEFIFDSMEMIQNNYTHYANLYNFNRMPYRNDYALGIALNINTGHFVNSKEYYIPWNLASVIPDDKIIKVETDTYELTYNQLVDNKVKKFRAVISDMDLHIMGKSYLEKIYED